MGVSSPTAFSDWWVREERCRVVGGLLGFLYTCIPSFLSGSMPVLCHLGQTISATAKQKLLPPKTQQRGLCCDYKGTLNTALIITYNVLAAPGLVR